MCEKVQILSRCTFYKEIRRGNGGQIGVNGAMRQAQIGTSWVSERRDLGLLFGQTPPEIPLSSGIKQQTQRYAHE